MFGLKDREVNKTDLIGAGSTLKLLLVRSLLLVIWILLALPGLLLNGPIALVAVYISEKKAKGALHIPIYNIGSNGSF
jgi:glycerol-3-phosphate O-acyltransferase/dihydroxyacetone phosphate acyltransferase